MVEQGVGQRAVSPEGSARGGIEDFFLDLQVQLELRANPLGKQRPVEVAPPPRWRRSS